MQNPATLMPKLATVSQKAPMNPDIAASRTYSRADIVRIFPIVHPSN
jgi:hypothetical protein